MSRPISSLRTVLGQDIVATATAPTLSQPYGEENSNFSHFPKLPTEIRLKIWEMVDQQPRRISFFTRKAYNVSPKDDQTLAPVPAMLHATSESRKVALKRNKVCGYSDCLYVNPAVDILVFFSCSSLDSYGLECERALQFSSTRTGKKILTLEVMEAEVTHLEISSSVWRLKNLERYAKFNGLEHLTLNLPSWLCLLDRLIRNGFQVSGADMRKNWAELWEGKGKIPKIYFKL